MLRKKKDENMQEIEEFLKNPVRKKKTGKDYRKIIDTLYKELKRRDDIIDQLKEEKEILFNASLRSSERLSDFKRIKEDKE